MSEKFDPFVAEWISFAKNPNYNLIEMTEITQEDQNIVDQRTLEEIILKEIQTNKEYKVKLKSVLVFYYIYVISKTII